MIKLKDNLEIGVSQIGYFILVGILINIGLTLFKTSSISNKSFSASIESKEVFHLGKPFSEEEFVRSLKRYNVPFPHIVMAQAYLESDKFTSRIFIENSNLFGMKKAAQRSTLAIGINRGHATYSHWEYSLFDYLIYQAKYYGKVTSEEEYFNKLSKSYADDELYIKKIRTLAENFKELF